MAINQQPVKTRVEATTFRPRIRLAIYLQSIVPPLQVKFGHSDPLAIKLVANADFIVRVIPTAFNVSDTTIHIGAIGWLFPWPVLVVWIPGHVRVHGTHLVADNTAFDGARNGHISDAPGVDPEMPIRTPMLTPRI